MKTKPRLLFLLFSIMFSLGFAITNGEDTTSPHCFEQYASFDTGEFLQYKVYYNWSAVWVGAGTAQFKVEDSNLYGEPIYHIKALGKTYKRYEWFYKVYDEYETYLSKNNYKPLRFDRNIKEGSFTKELRYHFDHENKEVMIDYIKRKGEFRRKNEKENISECTYDLLSILYYTRNIDYSLVQVNDTIPINLFMDGRQHHLYLRYLGVENLTTDLGTFRCLKLSPLLIDGHVFEGGERMTIWATDDDNRLPLLIESPLNVGAVKAYLEKFENLKYPMEALID